MHDSSPDGAFDSPGHTARSLGVVKAETAALRVLSPKCASEGEQGSKCSDGAKVAGTSCTLGAAAMAMALEHRPKQHRHRLQLEAFKLNRTLQPGGAFGIATHVRPRQQQCV